MSAHNLTPKIEETSKLIGDLSCIVVDSANTMSTGIASIDAELKNTRGCYTLVHAPAGEGKSDLLQEIAYRNLKAGVSVVHLALEMGLAKTLRRFLTLINAAEDIGEPFTVDDLEKADKLEDDQADSVAKAFASMGELFAGRMFMFDPNDPRTGEDVDFIEGLCIYLQSVAKITGKPPVVLIDYLQLLRTTEPRGTTLETYDAISAKLAGVAHATGCSVFAASAVNKDKSMRGSSMLGHDADIVMGLSTSDGSISSVRQATLKITKNRNGARDAIVVLGYEPAVHHFVEFD